MTNQKYQAVSAREKNLSMRAKYLGDYNYLMYLIAIQNLAHFQFA